MKTFKIAHLFYDLMNLYGENGNIIYLKNRLEEQGIKVELSFLSIEDKIDFNQYDMFYLGSGSEENQLLVLNDLLKYKDALKKAIKANKFFLVTGNSLELFGRQIRYTEKEPLQMTEIFDFVCNDDDMRIVGEQIYKFNELDEPIIGFENRLCTMSEYHAPLFDVISGCGYKPNVMQEGIQEYNFYGTYLFGPLLVRNPHFCDYLITKIMEYKEYELKEFNKETSAYKAYNEYLKNFYEKQ